MALAIQYEELIKNEKIKGYSQLSQACGIDRSAITKLMNLRLLNPKIQEFLLTMVLEVDSPEPITLKELLPITGEMNWEKQMEMFNTKIKGNK